MSTDVIFYTQLGSTFAFVLTAFVLYRNLVSAKDATIETLRERIALYKDQAAAGDPDILADTLSKRIKLLSEELNRLHRDSEASTELIARKEEELAGAKDMYDRLQRLVMHTSGMSVSYFCPECEAPTIQSAESKLTFHNRKADYFLVSYSCGYSELNGKKASECRGTLSGRGDR